MNKDDQEQTVLGANIRVISLGDIQFDAHNANQHTPEGTSLLKQSMAQRGFGRPVFSANDLTILGGNNAMQVARDLGYAEAILVETDGDTPIIHVRKDLTSDSADARTLAIEDNRIAQVSLNWNDAELLQAKQIGVNMAELFSTPAAVRSIAGILHSADEQAEEDEEDIGKTVQVLAPTPSLVDYISIGQTNIPITPDEVSGLSVLYERYTAAVGVHAGFLMWLLQDWEEE